MKKSLIITSIANDTHPVLRKFANECKINGVDFILIGDKKSPEQFNIDGCNYWDFEKQQTLPFNLAKNLPANHYSRKNLGYLIAIKNGAEEIIETDDDNIPNKNFWFTSNKFADAITFENHGWINVYRFFTKNTIWPRGFPIQELTNKPIDVSALKERTVFAPIQQGLVDINPDVDAIYRLTSTLPVVFEIDNSIALGKETWCSFNSQNTRWFKEAFPLMYLPSFCTSRMTDIWRSFIAQRIAWENEWFVYFHKPTVSQERNSHDLTKDFEDEIPGYLYNKTICSELQQLKLKAGTENIFENMVLCYQKLIDLNIIAKEEISLLNVWIRDFEKLN